MKKITTCMACGGIRFVSPMVLREMMFGFRDTFTYHTCDTCGTVQIFADIGDGLAKYYPSNYYSFSTPTNAPKPLKDLLLRLRASISFAGGPLARFATKVRDDSLLREMIALGLKKNSRVLDVGCGDGGLLKELARRGLTHLVGVDPYIQKEIRTEQLTIFKTTFTSIEGKFDFVMFHHSLEHFPNPLEAMLHARGLLTDNGTCAVRIPTPDSDAFERYGTNWMQLDPPRHYFIPSRQGMLLLGSRSGLRLTRTIDDFKAWSLWGSAQYERDIPLGSFESLSSNPGAFSKEELSQFQRDAEDANRRSRGDQAAFIFVPA